MEIDVRHMKVICQKCNKVGIHNVTILEEESGWHWVSASKGGLCEWDTWICIDCAKEEGYLSLSEKKIEEEK